MPVHPKIQDFLDKLQEYPQPPMDQVTPEAYRVSRNKMLSFQQNVEPVHKVEDRVLHLEGRDLPIRVYTPEGQAPHPALVYFHGGGWVIGSLDSHDSVCRVLANSAKCVVISVDYRLAPEHKFPAAVEDAYDSLQWIASNPEAFDIDVNRIAVGGDSAGGNLAAVACIMAKERKTPTIIHQLLIYPSTGYRETPPSMWENAEGYFLTREVMKWYQKHYFNNDQEILDPYASPVLYSDLSGLPPAAILTAQYDPIRDVGKIYAETLQENGVDVYYKNYEGLIHAFVNFIGFVPEARDALEEGAGELQKAFKSQEVK
jgi:acetyl esterase